jgi:hypothetical protein
LYYRFRLNWIILLAFHSLYINTSTPAIVGLLIDKMHEAFLGWMSREPNIFQQMFTPPNHRIPKNSHIDYSNRVHDIIVREIQGQPLLFSTLKTIKDKLCDLEENMALDIEADVDEDDDPDYVPSDDSGSDDGSDDRSGSASSGTSTRDSLSSSDISPRHRGRRNAYNKIKLDNIGSDIESDIESSQTPDSPTLSTDAVQGISPAVSVYNDAYGEVAAAGGVSDGYVSDGSQQRTKQTSRLIGYFGQTGLAQQPPGRIPEQPKTPRRVWVNESPSRNNPHIPNSTSEFPSPPQTNSQNKDELFIRRNQSQKVPSLDFGKVLPFDSSLSKQLLNRLPQDARSRPNTATHKQSPQREPPGYLSDRRPAIVDPDYRNTFKGIIADGNILPSSAGNRLPSSAGISSDNGQAKPVPPSYSRVSGVTSSSRAPRRPDTGKGPNTEKGSNTGKGGNRKYTRKRNDKKVYDKPKKTRRRNIQPVSSNKNKHTRKRART